MKQIIYRKVLPVVAGALLGFAYYYFIGCDGTCAITSSPYISTIYGGVLGLLISFPWKREKKKNDDNQSD
ncbi:MAG: DUF6132 family protein [Melioribacteraceae bacterium]|nr:DUF6132 family protein [Melioribacteraceae bacterium]